MKNIEFIFKQNIEKPFFYNFHLNKEGLSIKDLFNEIKNLYFLGFKIHYGSDSLVFDRDLKKKVAKINEYMLSMGISVNLEEYEQTRKDYYIRTFLYEIEKIKNVEIKITSDWKTSEIENVSITTNNNIFEDIKKIIYKKYKYIIHLIELIEPLELPDFCVKIKHENIVYVISFDYAKMSNKCCSY